MAILRVRGQFDPRESLRASDLAPYKIFRAGEPVLLESSSKRTHATDGFWLRVSDREFEDLTGQIEDAISFLRRYASELKRLVATTGIEDVRLDFPTVQRIDGENVAVQSDYLPPALIRLAGEVGVGIEITLYPPASDDADGSASG